MQRHRRLAATLTLVLLVLVGCTVDHTPSVGGRSGEAPPTTADESALQTTVDEDGFRAELDGVLVEGPAGVAEPGTAVTVRLVDGVSPDPDAELVALVDVVIGDHMQPREPVTITFDLDEQPGEGIEHVVLRSDSGKDNYVTVGHEVVQGRAVVTTDHLSAFSLFRFDPRHWLGELTKQIELGLGLQYPKPKCADSDFGHSASLDDAYFTAEGSGLGTVYLCADRLPSDELSMQYYSNGPVAWVITADPAPTDTMPIVQLRLGDLMATAGYRLANNYPNNKVFLAPGAQIGMRSPGSHIPIDYTGQVDSLWGGVALGVEAALGVASIGQAGKWQRLRDAADVQDAASCLSGTVSAGLDPQLGPVLSTATTCVQRLMSEAVGSSDALLLLRLGIVSRLVLVAPQGALSALLAANNDTFSVKLLSTHAAAAEGYEVPAYCDQPERRVQVGHTEADYKATTLTEPWRWPGKDIFLTSMVCSAGNVTWPGVLIAHDSTGRMLGEPVFLQGLEAPAYRGAFLLEQVQVSEDRVTVPYTWQSRSLAPYVTGEAVIEWNEGDRAMSVVANETMPPDWFNGEVVTPWTEGGGPETFVDGCSTGPSFPACTVRIVAVAPYPEDVSRAALLMHGYDSEGFPVTSHLEMYAGGDGPAMDLSFPGTEVSPPVTPGCEVSMAWSAPRTLTIEAKACDTEGIIAEYDWTLAAFEEVNH